MVPIQPHDKTTSISGSYYIRRLNRQAQSPQPLLCVSSYGLRSHPPESLYAIFSFLAYVKRGETTCLLYRMTELESLSLQAGEYLASCSSEPSANEAFKDHKTYLMPGDELVRGLGLTVLSLMNYRYYRKCCCFSRDMLLLPWFIVKGNNMYTNTSLGRTWETRICNLPDQGSRPYRYSTSIRNKYLSRFCAPV